MRKIIGIHGNNRQSWVGDGFPVRSLFSHASLGNAASPFLLLDYAGPTAFAPASHPRGVGSHPHKGFETVTIVYQGEVEHRDSTGQGGVIGPGEVQWMTAGNGILHQEFHSQEFTRKGGTLEMVQLWVNLPAANKGADPGYQAITAETIPVVDLGGAGLGRVIAGSLAGQTGPARTFTPINVWDLRLNSGTRLGLDVPGSHNVALVVLKGRIGFGEASVGEAQSLHLAPGAGPVEIEIAQDSTVLLLSGEPIDEPVVMHGPFVMNTGAEISAAIADFQAGRFGRIAATL